MEANFIKIVLITHLSSLILLFLLCLRYSACQPTTLTHFSDPLFSKGSTTNPQKDFILHLGSDKENNPLFLDLAHAPHIFLAAQTGYGQTHFISHMVHSARQNNKHATFMIFGVEKSYPHFSRWKTPTNHVGFTPQTWENMAATLAQETKRRKTRIQNASQSHPHITDATTYNQTHQQKIFPLFIVVEESAQVCSLPKLKALLSTLLHEGRTLGIFMLFATQQMHSAQLDQKLLTSFSTRIALHLTTPSFSEAFLGFQGAEKLSHGEALCLKEGKVTHFYLPKKHSRYKKKKQFPLYPLLPLPKKKLPQPYFALFSPP